MEQNISAADFPEIELFKKTLDRKDLTKFSPVKDKIVEEVQLVVATEISRFQLYQIFDETST